MLNRGDKKYGKDHNRDTQMTSDGDVLERQEQTNLVFKCRPQSLVGRCLNPSIEKPSCESWRRPPGHCGGALYSLGLQSPEKGQRDSSGVLSRSYACRGERQSYTSYQLQGWV